APVRRRVQLLQQQGAGHVAVPDVVLHVQGALCSPGQQHPRSEGAVRVGEGVDAALVGVCGYFGGQGLAEAGGAGALGIQGDGFGQVLRRQTATGKQADTEQQGGQPSVRLGESEVQHGGDRLAWPPPRGQDRAVYPANGGAKRNPLGRSSQGVICSSSLRQTLNLKCITSPSLTMYSLPSRRHLPASLAPASPLYWMKSS